MAKQLNVSLGITADTSQAKKEIQQLSQELRQLSSANGGIVIGQEITSQIKSAQAAAAQLKATLDFSTDKVTGKLDLSKFAYQLKSAGRDLNYFENQLGQLGPQGEMAFASLVSSIARAEVPLKRQSKLLMEMKTTLSNTLRWQFSSSLIHGAMSEISKAVSYAKDLDKSLTNIQIVTGQSSEQMAKFAAQANQAAKALSTTTTAYTDAALIFYQQGLDDKAVEERTNATIKMAQVTGDNVTEVSSYLTAIWNNFDDGSESLEHYADVITALGASTASSSAEIAAGLEKFASIGKTIGLSYDYATSALATIVANTRQSADSVGTGLRTIFSRLQGLSLGDTLEDGVDLNKYSKALKTVGVDVLDVSGDLRDMDDILDDLAGKWNSLSEAQQTALAQTVGGVRQYTTLISLMNNWDDMQTNLQTVSGADGTLQNQADIYADSWEAAQKRVQASAQAIYADLIRSDDFKNILNGFSEFLDLIDDAIDGIGGLPGVINLAGIALANAFKPELINSIDNLFIRMGGTGDAMKLLNQGYNMMIHKSGTETDGSTGAVTTAVKEEIELRSILNAKASELSQIDKEAISSMIQMHSETQKQLANEYLQLETEQKILNIRRQNKEIEQEEYDTQVKKLNAKKSELDARGSVAGDDYDKIKSAIDSALPSMQSFGTSITMVSTGIMQLTFGINAIRGVTQAWQDETKSIGDKLLSTFMSLGMALPMVINGFKQLGASQLLANIGAHLGNLEKGYSKVIDGTNSYITLLNKGVQKVDGKRIASLLLTTDALDSLTAAQITEMAAAGASTNATREETNARMLQTLATELGIRNVEKLSGAELKNAVAAKLMGKAGKEAFLGMIPGILAVVAAVAALGVGIYALVANFDKANISVAEANSINEELKQHLQDTKDALNQVKDGFKNYDSVIETLENCTKGTNDWKEALLDANGAALELINTLGLTANDYYLDSDGVIRFKDGVQERLETQATNDYVEAQGAQYIGNQLVREAQIAETTKDTTAALELAKRNQEVLDNFNNYGALAGQTGDMVGAQILGNTIATWISSGSLDTAIEGLTTPFEQLSHEQQVAQIEAERLNEQNKILTQQENSFMGNLMLNGRDFGNANSIAGQVYGELISNSRNAWLEQIQDRGMEFFRTADSKYALNEYLSKMNYTQGKDYDSIDYLANGNIKFVGGDKAGQELEASQIAAILAARDSRDSFDSSFSNSAKLLNQISNSAVATLLASGDISKLTDEEALDIGSLLSKYGLTDGKIDNLDGANNVGKLLADLGVSSELLTTLGLNIDSFIEQLANAPNAVEQSRQEIEDELAKYGQKEYYDNIISSDNDFNTGNRGVIANQIQNAFLSGGSNGVQSIVDMYEKLGDKGNVFADLTQSIIWTSTSATDLENAMKDAGIATDAFSQDELWNFIELMRNDGPKSLEEITSAWADQKKALSSLKEIGDTISADDFTKNFAGKFDSYFALMDDGTYQLIADAEEFYNLVNGQHQDDLWTTRQQAWQDYEVAEKLATEGSIDNFITAFQNNEADNNTIADYATAMGYQDEMAIKALREGTLDLSSEVAEALGQFILDQYSAGWQPDQGVSDRKNAAIQSDQALLSNSTTLEDYQMEQAFAEAIGNAFSQEEIKKQLLPTSRENAEDFGLDGKEVEAYAEALESSYEGLKGNEEMANRVAIANMRMNKGIQEMSSNISSWSKTLKEGRKDTAEYAKAIANVKNSLADMLDLDIEQISTDFASNEDTVALMERIAEGGEDAYAAMEELRVAAAQDIVVHMDSTGAEEDFAVLQNLIAEFDGTELEIGANMDTSGIDEALNALILSASMTVEEAQAILNSLGFEPEIEWQKVDAGSYDQISNNTTIRYFDSEGNEHEATMQAYLDQGGTGEVWVPIINGSGTKYTGAPKSTLGGGGKSSGGGGGGGSKKKKGDNDKDRYHEVNRNIKATEDAYSRLETEKSQVFGPEILDVLDQEIEKEKELLALEQAKLEEAQAYAETDKANLEALAEKDGIALGFGPSGEIENYDALIQSLIDKYNNEEIDDDEWSAWQDAIKNYEDSLDTLREQEKKKREEEIKIIEKELERVDEKAKIRIEIDDRELKLLDHYLKNIGDDAEDAADKIALMADQMAKTSDKIDANQVAMADIIRNNALRNGKSQDEADAMADQFANGDMSVLDDMEFTKEERDALWKYSDENLTNLEKLQELMNSVIESMKAGFDDLIGDMDHMIEKTENLAKETKTYSNIISMVGADIVDPDGSLQKAIADESLAIAEATEQQKKAKLDAIDNGIAQTKAELDKLIAEGGDSDAIKALQETLDEMEDERDEAYQDWLDSWENTIQAAADKFKTTVEQSVKDAEKLMAGQMGNLSDLKEQFDRTNEVNDIYLDDYDQIYQLSKLTRDINNSIDDTSNIAGKQKLKALIAEITDLQERGVELSQYDIDNLQRRYELELARQQLEDSRNAKSQVTMTRDNEGNYGYVYNADANAVADAEQNYEDKLYAMQKANSEYIEQLQSNIIDAEQAYAQALAALDVNDANYLEKVAALQRDYGALIDGYTQQLDNALGNNQALYENDWQKYSEATGYKISADEDFIDKYEETVHAYLTGYDEIDDIPANFADASQQASADCIQAFQDFHDKADPYIGEIEKRLDPEQEGSIAKELDEISKQADQMAKDFEGAYQGILTSTDTFLTQYNEKMSTLKSAIETAHQALTDLQSAAAQPITTPTVNAGTPTTGGGDGGGNGGSPTGPSGGPTTTYTIKLAFTNGNSAPASENFYSYYGTTTGSYSSVAAAHPSWHYYKTSGTSYLFWQKNVGANATGSTGPGSESFDTGGYTGDWGTSDGKMAMLHEKELVLNKEDTPNVLKAIEFVRQIASVIDLNAMVAGAGSSFFTQLGSVGDTSNELQQDVHITAEFPNATDKQEILEAFDNVINLAASYAHRF